MFTPVQSAVIQWILLLSILKWLYISLILSVCVVNGTFSKLKITFKKKKKYLHVDGWGLSAETQCASAHRPINYGYKECTRRRETKYILQIHFNVTFFAPLRFYSPSPRCFRCGSALQMRQERLYIQWLNTEKNPDTWWLRAYSANSGLVGILHNNKHS